MWLDDVWLRKLYAVLPSAAFAVDTADDIAAAQAMMAHLISIT